MEAFVWLLIDAWQRLWTLVSMPGIHYPLIALETIAWYTIITRIRRTRLK